MAQCVYCDKTDTLNTQLSIKMEDDTRVTVDICDEHADDATIKTAREAHLGKQQKIAEVLAQAKALGLDISENKGGLVIATKSSPPAAVAKPQLLDSMKGENIVDTSRIDGRSGMKSIGGNEGGVSVASHASHVVEGGQDKLPAEALEGKAQMGLIEGREGMPIAIPEKRVDGTGTTHIKVLKSDDNQLQSRFKKMADDSIAGKTPDFARQGYSNTTVNCGMCRGSGVVVNLGESIECPKCKGAGILSTY